VKFEDVDGVVHCLLQDLQDDRVLEESVPRVYLLCGKIIVQAVEPDAQTSCLNCLSRGEVAEVRMRPGLGADPAYRRS
jgi:hypothetical protein